MAINPVCDKCHAELTEFGAILLGPPDETQKVKKYHFCQPCYKEIEPASKD